MFLQIDFTCCLTRCAVHGRSVVVENPMRFVGPVWHRVAVWEHIPDGTVTARCRQRGESCAWCKLASDEAQHGADSATMINLHTNY